MSTFFGGLWGGGETNDTQDGADIVDKMIERIITSDIFEDRRDALRTLKSVTKQMRTYVAKSGVPLFLAILENEDSNELLVLTLDILQIVLGDTEEAGENEDELGDRFAEVIIEQPNFIGSLLGLVEISEFSLRKSLIQLFTSLLRYRGSEVQSAIYKDPMGIGKFVDLLIDQREAIRNSAVLMMGELSKANSEIQQLLAYHNVFAILFDIIGMELYDSIVIEDCLFVMLNLLRKNTANQQLFRETQFVQRVAVLYHSFMNLEVEENEYDATNGEWPKQKIANVIFILQVIRSLISPADNVASLVHAAQKMIYHTGILGELCKVLCDERNVSMEVLTETVVAVAEAIRGNYTNQEYFAKTNIIYNGGQSNSYLIVLLRSMAADNQPLKLRCAVFYCFICYLHGNTFGKIKAVETLTTATSLSSVPDPRAETVGQWLLNAVLSTESLQIWFGSVSVMHSLIEQDDLKNKLLGVKLTVSAGGTSLSSTLLTHIASQLISYGNRRPQARAAILMLLCVWTYNCPAAISELLSRDENVNYLTTQINESGADGTDNENQVVRGLIAFLLGICLQFQNRENGDSKNNLWDLIERRVGRETLAERMDGVSKSEQYVRAAQRPQPYVKSHTELLLDYQFTKLFKSLEGSLTSMLQPGGDPSNPVQNNENIVASFKELIRKQDSQISALTQQVKKLTAELDKLQPMKEQTRNMEDEMNKLRDELSSKLSMDDSVAALNVQLETANAMAQQWQAEVARYQQWAQQWQNFQIGQHASQDAVVQQLTAQVAELDQQLQFGWQAYETQGQEMVTKMNFYTEKIDKLERELATAQEAQLLSNGEESTESPKDESDEMTKLRREQEDLLVLLADQDSKLRHYRRRLVDVGENVSDDDDADDE
ncbi:hypothetical protein L596_005294 [Steinernema carpocapsae]|uniref:Vesicle tethering protein Uso1/P115-like head domain-containing protein n=1 Tax=Steinernema carpocapsae TaxID=34508 RepID=A0A4U8UZM4_STECR|nr:hypothetical protein L596_005294 [Steinernema carpocapsae]